MLKLTFTLAVALYAGFIVWGRPTEMTADVTPRDAPAAARPDAALYDRPVILTEPGAAGTDDARVTRAAVEVVVPDAASIAASAPAPDAAAPRRIGEPVTISLYAPEAEAEPEIAAADGGPAVPDTKGLLRVSGDRVNMRAGPSTADGVVGSLLGGTLAEALGPEAGGWIEVRDVESGRTGFMSARFLEPA